MNVELTAEELQRVIRALKEQSRQHREAGEPATETDALIARLEQSERDFRRQQSP